MRHLAPYLRHRGERHPWTLLLQGAEPGIIPDRRSQRLHRSRCTKQDSLHDVRAIDAHMLKATENWLAQVDYDLATAEHMLHAGRYIYVIFMSHLALNQTTQHWHTSSSLQRVLSA